MWNPKDYRDDGFTLVGDILQSALPMDGRFKHSMKCSTLFGFWGKIVGKRFENFSKPLNIKYSKMTVACENNYVAQEMSLFKSDILKKTQTYAAPLGLVVKDIIFSTKGFLNG